MVLLNLCVHEELHTSQQQSRAHSTAHRCNTCWGASRSADASKPAIVVTVCSSDLSAAHQPQQLLVTV
jgi:hypothetical protein